MAGAHVQQGCKNQSKNSTSMLVEGYVLTIGGNQTQLSIL